jgi:transcriptional regulator with XRE-family HTH domain
MPAVGELSLLPADHTPRYERFLTRLREARRLSGLTQAEVAARLGKPQSFVSKMESGERRLDFVEVVLLSEIYELPLDFFKG